MHLMVLLGDVFEVEARFSLFRDGVNLDARLVDYVRQWCNSLISHVGRTRWIS